MSLCMCDQCNPRVVAPEPTAHELRKFLYRAQKLFNDMDHCVICGYSGFGRHDADRTWKCPVGQFLKELESIGLAEAEFVEEVRP